MNLRNLFTKTNLLKLPKKVTIIGLFALLTMGLGLGFFILRLDTPSILGWMDNWMYRKAITVTNNGSTLTNTDVLLVIDTASLIAAEKLQSTCADLRFTDSDESTALSYWIETGCNTATTQIWVRIPSVPNGGKIIYMYYHNYTATTSTEMAWTGSFTFMATGTCPAGWTRNTSFDNKFAYGSATYGNTGGSADHNHTASGTTNSVAATIENYDSGNSATSTTHTHTYNFSTVIRTDTYPPYLQMIFCSKNQKLEIPTGLISIFDTSQGTGWTRFTGLDNKFAMGNAAYGATGGTDTQTDAFSGSTSGPSGTSVPYKNYSTNTTRSHSTHTHTFSGTTDASSILPPYINVLFYSKNATGVAVTNQIAMVNTIPPLGWTRVTAFDAKFLRGASTYGGTGGATTHTHTYSTTSSVATLAAVNGVDDFAALEHSHTVSGTTAAGNNVPPYFSTIYVKRNTSLVTSFGAEEIVEVPNTPPDTPTGLLTEGQTNPASITDATPEFSAIFSDVDTLDQGGYYQIQVNTDSAFTGATIWDSGQAAFSTPVENGARSPDITYAGTSLSANITFYWRIRFWTTAVQGGIPSEWSSVAQFMLTVSTWTSDTYLYRKPIFVNNTSGSTLSNQDVLVQVDTTALVAAGKMKSNCYDMRFYDSNDTTALTYFVESGCNTTTTQVWVRVPSVPNGGKTILMYHGNTAATNGELSWTGNFYLLASAACPTGWTRNAAYDNRFAYGSATYGTNGGSATHTHTISGTTNSVAATIQNYDSGTSGTSVTHTHTYSFASTAANSNPAYLQVLYCYKNKLDISAGLISIFDASPGTGWTRFAVLDNKFAMGGSTYGATGGADTQTEDFSGSTAAASGTSVPYKNYSTNTTRSPAGHTHTVSGTTASSSILPPYINVLYYSKNAAGVAVKNQITIASTIPPLGWTRVTAFDSKYLRGASTYGGTGGATTHTHTYSATTSVSSLAAVNGANAYAALSHSHTVSGTTGAANNLPLYYSTIFVKRVDSLAATLGTEETIPPSPPVPTTLFTEGIINPAAITDRSPEFSAIFTDIHTSHTGTYYQIQVNDSSDFSGATMWDSTKIAITIANAARSANISYAGETLEKSTTYYWRIKFWDSRSTEGEWVSAQFTMSDNVLYFSDMSASNITSNSATIFANIFSMPLTGATDTGFWYSTYPTLEALPKPVSAYYLNETDPSQIIDSVGGLNGTNSGSTVITGIIGNAHSFNGTSDYISIPDSATLTPSAITVEAWIKPTALPSSGGIMGIVNKRSNSGTAGYVLELFNNSGTQQIVWVSVGAIRAANYTLPIGVWTHVVVTQSSTTATLYVNGVSVSTGSVTALLNDAVPLLIGKRQDAGTFFNGVIDNVVIYNTGFTATDVKYLYNNGVGTEAYSTKVSTGAGVGVEIGDGNDGGARIHDGAGGGGGGAGSVGGTTTNGNFPATISGAGGNGKVNPIVGSTSGENVSGIYYLAGGGSGGNFSTASGIGTKGKGGGAAGQAATIGDAGTVNTGGGGGGGGQVGGTPYAGGAGGSGIVIVRYPTAQNLATGGTVTTSGAYTIHTFTSSQTITINQSGTLEVLVVAGGAGGGYQQGGGGGAGGFVYDSSFAVASGSIDITVGLGGAGGTSGTLKGTNGENSVFSSIIALGGGGGGSNNTWAVNGGSGGGGGIAGTGAGGRSIKSPSNIAIPISADITGLSHLTDYYFKPYAVYDGDTVYGHSASFTTLVDNYPPTASKDNISGTTDIYAGKTIDIQSIYSDPDGISNLDKAFLQIKNPSGTNIEYYATLTESNQTGQTPASVSGSEYVSNITYDTSVNSPTANDITVTWHITPNWNWTRDTSIQYGVKAADKTPEESTYDYTVATYKYENRLTFTGTLVAKDYNNNVLNSGDWTKPNSNVNFTGIKVVYAGTTDIYPNDIDFDARVTNSEASFWDDYTSVGRDISINATTVDATNASDTYTFSIPEIPNGGQDISNITFVIKTDKTSPVISSLTSPTHPDSNTWYTATTATFNWTITDVDSGLQGVWYLLNNSETTSDADVISNGVLTSENQATLNGITTNTWYLHLVARDNFDNTSSSTYTIKVDTSIPDIIAVTGLNNDTWQNTDAGPVISWTDPNSPSNDTFYITINGSEPTSTNYAYTTTANTYDLPNQAEGITTIKVRAMNGVGTYSTTRSFVVKFDSTNPTINTLTSSTHPNPSLWYNSSTATFNWTITESGSGIQNTWYVLNTNATMEDADVVSGGTATSDITTTINDLTTNTWYFHLVVKDNCNNTTSSVYTLKVDVSVPDIIAVTGNNNNIWQNVDSDPIISWTDPNSLSDDTFYITNNGSEPTSTNYAYTTTSNTYDLPNQAEGTTTIKVRAQNGIGTYGTTRSFIIKYEITNPVISSLTSSTHPNPSLWYNLSTATFNWVSNDADSGVQNTWYVINTNAITSDADVISGGTATSETTATINDLTTNTWYFHLVVRDNANNTIASTYSLKVDMSIPDIIAVTGDNNDTWQNVNSGPIISWTDPNSLSDDTFYITNNDSEPTSTNYAYTTTNNSYDLPNQAEGITTIKVRAQNGIGAYSVTRTFTIKYDSTNPVINSLTSSTHPDSNTWYHSPTATFSWTTTEEGSGIQNSWYLLDTNPTTTNENVISGGTTTSDTTATISNLTSNIQYFHLVVKDNCGGTVASTYTVKADVSVPNIVAVTGDNNDIWQNVNSGPVISWTDPNSLSDDTFYITTDGTFPASTNYAYTTTSNTYDLPNQAEGITTIKVRAANGAGTYGEPRTFIIKYDNTLPVITSLTSSTHPNSNIWYADSTATFNWEITENGSGIQNTWYLLDTNPTTTDEDVIINGTPTIGTTVTINDIGNSTWYFHLVTRDNCEATTSATYSFKIDDTIPDIVAVTGDYNDVWQNVNAGPVISWTDPNSSSDDTFYITNDGTEPTATNFTYTTTNTSYDLPDQAEGITTIKVRALNGSGIYSTTKSFIVKNDNTAPTIASLTSSTHPNSNVWYSSSTAIFNWTITEEGSGIQNTWYLLNSSATVTNDDVINTGITITSSEVTINEITNNTSYFHLVTRDNSGNTTSATYSLKIDTSTPDIISINGLYNNVWQNVDAGPVISWTDPNSPSNDTFYITNDGSEPTTANYRYTLTNSSFDLPDQNEDEITIKVRAISGAGIYSETRAFVVKYDNTNPTISTLTSSTHSDSNAWYSSSTATFNWSILEEGSGIKNTWYLLDNNASTSEANVISNGTSIVENTVTKNDITSNIWYFHLVTRDNCDLTTSSTYSFKVDTSTPEIINITGLYNNEWQDIDAGPVISWTDPNSLSNDTFYITNNGSEPTSANYTYTTTANTFNLPDQAEGEITIKVRAINGANTNSEIRSFIVKYNSANPEIPTLMSTTHPNQEMWYTSSNLSINWVATDDRSGISKVWNLLDQIGTQTSSIITNTGTETTTTGTYNTTLSTNGTWYFHLLAQNNQGLELSKTFKVNIDNTTSDIVAVTGNNNNIWQNTDAGPVISWTDPNSISNDTFYITNNGTEPTTTNFAYSTTSSTYDLPAQKQGETTIRVRSVNGAGTSSETRNFIIRYDGIAPANVSELKATATTNSVTLTWADPTIFDFTHVVIVKNTLHLPLSITDGTIVYENTDPTFTDLNLTDATDYYYAIFTLDTVGNRSSGAIIQVKTLSVTPEVPTIPETPTTPTIPNTPATPINVVIPPIDNNTKIIKAQDLPIEKQLNVTTDEKTITTTSIGNLHVYPKQTLQIEIPAKTIGDESADIRQVILTINNEAYNLEYNSVSKTYYTIINAPAIKGTYDTIISTISNKDKNVFTITTSLLVDPYGYVFSKLGQDEIRISNAKVSLYTKKDGIEILYQSSAGINNPQYTNAQGEYQYFVEPGEYKLVVESQGYIPSETEWFTVEKNIIEKNIEMERNPYFWYGVIAIAEIAIGFTLVVIRKKKRRRTYV